MNLPTHKITVYGTSVGHISCALVLTVLESYFGLTRNLPSYSSFRCLWWFQRLDSILVFSHCLQTWKPKTEPYLGQETAWKHKYAGNQCRSNEWKLKCGIVVHGMDKQALYFRQWRHDKAITQATPRRWESKKAHYQDPDSECHRLGVWLVTAHNHIRIGVN